MSGYEVVELIIPQHVDDLMPLLQDQHAEGYPHLDFSEVKIRWFIDKIIRDLDRDLRNCFLCYKGHELIGYAYASVDEFIFSTQKFAHVEMIYVVPEYRGSRAYLKLMKAYEEWARLRGCVEFWAGVAIPDRERADKISNTLEKVGYSRYGYIHKKGIGDGRWS